MDVYGWGKSNRSFRCYRAWIKCAPRVSVGCVDEKRRRVCLLAPKSAVQELERLICEIRENAVQLENAMLLERALLFQSHLLAFVNNFVSRPDLYVPAEGALFEMGVLILDGLELSFCARVAGREKHSRRCQGENMFVFHAGISSFEGRGEYEVAAPAIVGVRGGLRVGQWGGFQCTRGREINVRVTRVIESTTGLWEGVATPFKRLGKATAACLDSDLSGGGKWDT
ncbi:MAG: hypothetical protein M2R45_03919 [Verrucomicrobia subdivision 3 bacterium]|nr:hypothetical protein [Limisphaerales bacterium]MCS1417501.1 hypothetical protein [Limisphaerales bacterium]